MYAFTIAVMVTAMFGCSESEQLFDGIPASGKLEAVGNNDPQPILTKSEMVALNVQKKGTYKISETEAISNLKQFTASVSGNEKSMVKTKSINLKKNPVTGKEMYYEVVFDSDKGTGFCILSADERTDDILCYSERGSISDTVFNKSFKFCLELVNLYVEEQTKEELDIKELALSAKEKLSVIGKKTLPDEVITKAIPPFNPDDPNSPWYYGRTDTKTTVDERLKIIKGGWHQEAPFNDLLPTLPPDYNQRAYVGCVMVAVAQIMSYHRKPFSNYITTSTWQSMIDNPDGSVEVRNLMRDLFNDMVISFDKSGSSSNTTKARSFLNRNGYTTGSVVNYSYNNVWNALNNGPTYIEGDRQADTGKIGHAWVVDGARTTTTRSTEIYYCNYNGRIIEHNGNTYTYTRKEVRYDWGHGVGYENIWFNDNIFLMRSGRDYKYNVALISYIR